MLDRVFSIAGLISHDKSFEIGFYTVLVAVIALLLARAATSRLQTVPGPIQNFFEALLGGIISTAKEAIGEEKARHYLPLTGTLAIFICIANLLGIVPGFEAPTSNINFTLTLALIVFVYYNYEGIRTFGVARYFAHFAGPLPVLAPFMFVIEIISHCSRVISLSFRLFGNIKGDDMFLIVMLFLAPWFAPLASYLILTFMAFLQAFIFMILTYVFLAGAVLASEEGH